MNRYVMPTLITVGAIISKKRKRESINEPLLPAITKFKA